MVGLLILFINASPVSVFGELDHHEHSGVTDASPSHPGHAHGDADDHHNDPDSPCHHHVIHCGCHLGEVMIPADGPGSIDAQILWGMSLPILYLHCDPNLVHPFHVPIA